MQGSIGCANTAAMKCMGRVFKNWCQNDQKGKGQSINMGI